MRYILILILFFSCDEKMLEMRYVLNDSHTPTIERYYEYLSTHPLCIDVTLDYSIKSLEHLQSVMAKAFMQGDFDPHRDLIHRFDWAIVVYVGEVYLRNNDKTGEWLSTHETRFIPFGIRNGDKTATRFSTLVYDTLHEYPYQIKAVNGSESELFDLKLMYDYISYELERE